ncbi:MAG: cyclase family protein [Chloroflexota bacterium]|nr:cyclase family protein [Chloroflexota bacterium]
MTEKKIYDITLTIHPEMLIWPGDALVTVDAVKSIAQGASSNLSLLHIGTHTGTHIDAPRHFIDGAAGVDSLPPEILIGPARLFQLPDVGQIDREVLEKLDLAGTTRILFGTRNSALLTQDVHTPDYVSMTEDGARYLVDAGIELVGIDYLSVEAYRSPGHATHRTLLEAGVVIIEGVYLQGIPSGDYELLCLPLKLKDADGSPSRVLLREL